MAAAEKNYTREGHCGMCRRFHVFSGNIHAGICLVTDKMKEDVETCRRYLAREKKECSCNNIAGRFASEEEVLG